MDFQVPKNTYTGSINVVKLGKDNTEILIGGEHALPFYGFEGELPNKPVIAIEVYDKKPDDWPEIIGKYYNDVFDDPVRWAKKSIDEYGADVICLKLTRINPEGDDISPEEAADITVKVRESITRPLIVYGTGPMEKIADVMKKVSEKNAGTNILMGWVEEDNYKTIAAAAIGYNNNVIALNPLDVNIAKQINILLTQLGLPADRIVMDPSTSSVGYGIEYCYSAMERLKIAALMQDDKMTQMPIITNIAPEVWKIKEVRESEEAYPEWGSHEERAINWETISCMSMLLAGANILVMRHPKAVSLIKEAIKDLM
ncbi:MAG: acetyl-CoA decarbonylase/synthase complex subunit delta [Actinomycetota bacterium]|nr:acetyl-CoA decarbonylase/synthase complex subunit delta [Actinomycetota bacterium]MDD5600898.1 acetyl-CoA decarbonylase/synthase complex subunit delta [Actinomycetota bacterium]